MPPRAIHVRANGKPFDVPEGTTVAEFVQACGLDPAYVIVERNSEPLERTRYATTQLVDGDRLELVRAVAGG